MFEKATGQDWRVQDDDFVVFNEGIAPLAEAGKLGPLLAQFPTSFRPDAARLNYLEDLIRRLREAGFPRLSSCATASGPSQKRRAPYAPSWSSSTSPG